MNKKLLAIAIAGVLAAPLAQAQTANVVLYGRINIDSEVIINQKQDTSTSTNSIKQNIFGSSISFCVVLIHNTNGFVGDLPSKRVKSLKVTRHAGFAIAVVSPIKLGWSTTPQGHFSRLLDPKKRAYALIPIERIVAQEGGLNWDFFKILSESLA